MKYLNLKNVDLQRANCGFADFSDTELTNANFKGADCRFSTFRYAKLFNADVEGADKRIYSSLTRLFFFVPFLSIIAAYVLFNENVALAVAVAITRALALAGAGAGTLAGAGAVRFIISLNNFNKINDLSFSNAKNPEKAKGYKRPSKINYNSKEQLNAQKELLQQEEEQLNAQKELLQQQLKDKDNDNKDNKNLSDGITPELKKGLPN